MLGKVFRRYSNFWIFEDAGNSGGKTSRTERNFEKFRYTSQCCPLFLHSGKRYHWKAPCPAPLLPAKIQTKRRSNSPHMLPKRSEMVKIAMDTSCIAIQSIVNLASGRTFSVSQSGLYLADDDFIVIMQWNVYFSSIWISHYTLS